MDNSRSTVRMTGRPASQPVPRAGLEPARAFAHNVLSVAWLPFHHLGGAVILATSQRNVRPGSRVRTSGLVRRRRFADHVQMSKLGRWVVPGVLAAALLLPPRKAQASDVSDAAPFMIMAAVFTVTIVVIAINNPTDDDTDTGSSGTTTEEETQGMRYAPVPKQPPPRMIGFTGHF